MKAGYWFLSMSMVLVRLVPAQERTATPVPGFPAQAFPAFVFPATPPSSNFGMIGVGLGQTIRVVATNVGVAPPVASPLAIPACGVNVKFFDSDGKQVGMPGHTDSLDSGKSFAAEQPGPTTGRAEYRAEVQIVIPSIPSATSNPGTILTRLVVCNIVSTLQVYDPATGKTDFALSGNPIGMGYIPGPPCQKGEVCALAFSEGINDSGVQP